MNKSRTAAKTTKKRFRPSVPDGRKTMTLQEAKSIARHLGFTLRQARSGDYQMNFRNGYQTTACYTKNLEAAVDIALEMARKRK